jgi:glycosyltransferase involved in cell wall biosynthesis
MIAALCKPWKGEIMRVLMVSGDPINGDHYGGVEEHTNNLIKYLSKNNQIDLHVLMFSNPASNSLSQQVHFLKRLTERKYPYPLLFIFDILRLIKIINNYSPDVVHFQATSPLFCITALWIQKKFTTLLTVHGILMHEVRYMTEQNIFINNISRFIEKYAFIKLENIIVVAPQVQDMIRSVRKKKIYVVPNGIEVDNIETIKPAIIKNNNTIIYVGNLVERKGVHFLLKALISIKRKIPNIYLLIAGSGPQEESLRHMVLKHNLNDNVCFLGFIRGEEKYSYIKAAKILVLPTLWESLPIVILEGMACGKPIVASNVGGIPFLINDGTNGYLIDPGDIQNLADKIVFLLQNKEILSNMGEANLIKIQNYRWEKIASDTFKIYSTFINSISE